MQRANVSDYSVNDLRNTFIIENIKRGVDLVTISQAAGHKRLSTTERYLDIAEVKESGHKQKLDEL
jgi:site-specific recombinase XerD